MALLSSAMWTLASARASQPVFLPGMETPVYLPRTLPRIENGTRCERVCALPGVQHDGEATWKDTVSCGLSDLTEFHFGQKILRLII